MHQKDTPVFEVVATIVCVAVMLWAVSSRGPGAAGIYIVIALIFVLIGLWGDRERARRARSSRAYEERERRR